MESTATAASQHTFLPMRMQGAILVSDPALFNSPVLTMQIQGARLVSDPIFLNSPLDRTAINRTTEGRWKQRLFVASPQQAHGQDDSIMADRSSMQTTITRRSPIFPIRHRVVLPKMRIVQMQCREARSPIVLFDSDSSRETSEDEQKQSESIAISRVVSEILGRNHLEESDDNLFNDPVDVETTTLDCVARHGNVVDPPDSPVGFQDKDKLKPCCKRDKNRIERKDVVSSANLAQEKIKQVSKYPCCESLCLLKFGRDEVAKHRTYYYGLTHAEKNVLLRGCLKHNLQGRSGYVVNGKSFCRLGFKKLYSVGNNRLQKVSEDIFCRRHPDTFHKEKSTTQLALVQWLNDFFVTNVESLPNKDIFICMITGQNWKFLRL